MKTLLAFSFWCLFLSEIDAQNLDSLKRVFVSHAPDSDRINASYIIGRIIMKTHPDSAFRWIEQAKKMSEVQLKLYSSDGLRKRTYMKKLANCNLSLGLAHFYLSEHDSAIPYFNEAIRYRKALNDKKGEAAALNNIGLVYYDRGQMNQALDVFYQSLKLKKEAGDKAGTVNALGNIANVYKTNNQYKEALQTYEQSLKVAEELGDKYGIESNLHNIASIHDNQGKFELALGEYRKALQICREIDDKEGIALALDNIGEIYCKTGKVSEGIESKLQALKILEQIQDKNSTGLVYAELGRIYLHENMVEKALEMSMKGLQAAREAGSPESIGKSAQSLKEIYLRKKNYAKAFEMFELYIKMRDSLSNQETRKASVKKQLQAEYEKKALADSLKSAGERKSLSLKLDARDATIKKERTQKIALYGGLFLVLVFSIFMFNRFKITQRQKKVIEHQKHLVEEHRKEILDSINYAKRIQYTLLAHDDFLTENLPEHFVLFKPKDIVSGDFYWAARKDNRFYLAVCDSTGHGVPGAFMSLLNISFLNEAINEKNITQPHEILDHVRKQLIDNLSKEGGKDGMDAILICIEQGADGKHITYAAANNTPLLVKKTGAVNLPADKMPVGNGPKMDLFTLRKLEFSEGDMLYLYTDGYADQFGGPKGKKFRYKQLEEILFNLSDKEMNTQKNEILRIFDEWKGSQEQIDDVCLAGIRL